MTLIELVVASGIFAIVSTGIIAGLSQLFKAQQRLQAKTTEDRIISALIENIRANVHLYQSSFLPADSKDANDRPIVDVMLQTLPVAFSDSIMLPADECPECPGRLGFVLQPMPGMLSLYRVTLRVQHPLLFGRGNTREYRFIASLH